MNLALFDVPTLASTDKTLLAMACGVVLFGVVLLSWETLARLRARRVRRGPDRRR